MSNSATPAFDSAAIVDHHDLYFDAGDKRNGSLYLCVTRGAQKPDAALAALRDAALWSADDEKSVGEEQREAYKAGLKFVDAVRYRGDAGEILLARFDHPKFPSDAARWADWLALFDRSLERVG